ncbi:MAG: 5-formyltetrahydrofolate cyclo-ligase [Saccharofermentanales bacterium]
MDKQEMRDRIRTIRESQIEATRIEKSDAICRNLLSLELFSPERVKGRRIALFCSHKGEPETLEMYRVLSGYGAECFFPIVKGHHILMGKSCEGQSGYSGFRAGELGIPEPEQSMDELVMMDIIIIPGIAFSEDGHRIGYGKGYYDKYISRYLTEKMPPVIAPAFEFQVVSEIVPSSHDIPVDVIVTEKRIIYTGARNGLLQ